MTPKQIKLAFSSVMEKFAGSAPHILPIRQTRSTIFGIFMPDKPIPEWEALLSSR